MIPFKEHTITLHLQILMPHILYFWKPIINVHLCATYTAVMYPWFLARMQYFCKHSFWALCKECLITLHILNVTICIICHYKAFINAFPCAAYAALLCMWFIPHLHYLCKCSFTTRKWYPSKNILYLCKYWCWFYIWYTVWNLLLMPFHMLCMRNFCIRGLRRIYGTCANALLEYPSNKPL